MVLHSLKPAFLSRRTLVALCAALLVTPALALDALELLSKSDTSAALREALTKGADTAVAELGKPGGFLDSDRFRISLPPVLDRAASAMRLLGLGGDADELKTAINRAAEAAVPESRALLVQAVHSMTVEDAKAILTGPDDAATQYFRKVTHDQLAVRFQPIVHQQTARSGLGSAYEKYAGQAAQLHLIDDKDARLDPYVTEKALDALYALIAEKEKAIRKDPVGQGSQLLSKVFGAALHQ